MVINMDITTLSAYEYLLLFGVPAIGPIVDFASSMSLYKGEPKRIRKSITRVVNYFVRVSLIFIIFGILVSILISALLGFNSITSWELVLFMVLVAMTSMIWRGCLIGRIKFVHTRIWVEF